MTANVKRAISNIRLSNIPFSKLSLILEDNVTKFAFGAVVLLLFLGLFGPMITPYAYDEPQYDAQGSLERMESPSLQHPLGTTAQGYDILSRLVYGAQPTIYAAILGGSISVLIGASIGITAGYVGGRVESALMRITDFMYGVPIIPFSIVLITFFGTGYTNSILVIALIYWRVSARVLRSQVLQIKQRPFIEVAKATGASPFRIVYKHILPNIANMLVLWFALSAGYVVLFQSGLAFLGITSPFIPSWGVMIRNAYQAGQVYSSWWWSIPPGLLISVTVLSTFLLGRGYENVTMQGESDT